MSIDSGKMNERERAIGARVKEFREAIHWGQPDFAEQIRVTVNQLASIEYGRTPLRYTIAWNMRSVFGMPLEWLYDGSFNFTYDHNFAVPFPKNTGKGENALFSSILAEFFREIGEEAQAKTERKRAVKFTVDKGATDDRMAVLLHLQDDLIKWLSQMPDYKAAHLMSALVQRSAEVFVEYGAKADDSTYAKFAALLLRKNSIDVLKRLGGSMPYQNKALTVKAYSLTNEDVKPVLPKLLQRLKSATQERGKKVELAKWLGVHRQMVTDWLSKKQEPGGEITLQLLHWVEQQERQK